MSACSLTASRGICGDWACFAEGWGVHGRGVGCARQGVVDGRVSCVAGVRHLWLGGHTYPPRDRMTDACRNITLPQTSFVGGNKEIMPTTTK